MNNQQKIDYIAEKLEEARQAYYNSDDPLMSDTEFDSLEDELKSLDPENEYFRTVGIDPSAADLNNLPDSEKVLHEIPMLSMQKAKTPSEVKKWMHKIAADFSYNLCIQPKIDGISATCVYDKGNLQYVATRGDGKRGQDISHIAEYVKDIQTNVGFSNSRVEVRGELYLPKDTSFNTEGRPLRNNCAGLISRKDSREDLKYVRFAAYQIAGYHAFKLESSKIKALGENGFNAVEYFTVSSYDAIDEIYDNYLSKFRDKWLYETDGLIITIDDNSLFEEIDSRWVVDHHHHYAIALKPPAEAKETTLKYIEWQVSRQGNIVPVAVFSPIKIGGANIERATLNNYENVISMDLRSGDKLLIERANDVIPFIRENLTKESHEAMLFENDLIIKKCPSCGFDLFENGVHRQCKNRECPEINIQQILYWVKQSEIETVAEATIRTLYENNIIRSISDLYALTEKSFEGIPGFADKKIFKILSEIQSSKKVTALDFISRLGIPLVQKKSLKKLNILTIDDFKNFSDDTYVIGRNIIHWRENQQNAEFFRKLMESLEIVSDLNSGEKGKVCMTGTGPKSRKEIISDIESKGYEFSSSVTKDTDILLCDNVNGTSSKIKKARAYNVQIMTYSDFFK